MNKEADLIGFAHKVLSFRMNVAKACKAKGVEIPSDEKIGEYLNLYGFNLNDFMADYMEKEGIFRNPIDDFVKDVQAMELDNPPSEEEIRKYAEEHELNLGEFVKFHNINAFKGISKQVLIKTLELNNENLVRLWNTFIEESALYNENSYIYDLDNEEDVNFIANIWPAYMQAELTRLKKKYAVLKNKKDLRFIQWFADTDDTKIHIKKDIGSIIIAYWGEIFERIIAFPNIYNKNGYFLDIVWEIVKEYINFDE